MSPKTRCGRNRRRSGLSDTEIWRRGGNTKGPAGAIRGRGPALFLRSSTTTWQANHRFED